LRIEHGSRRRRSRTDLWSECHEKQPADHYHETCE
jgi:hypothetical protein